MSKTFSKQIKVWFLKHIQSFIIYFVERLIGDFWNNFCSFFLFSSQVALLLRKLSACNVYLFCKKHFLFYYPIVWCEIQMCWQTIIISCFSLSIFSQFPIQSNSRWSRADSYYLPLPSNLEIKIIILKKYFFSINSTNIILKNHPIDINDRR